MSKQTDMLRGLFSSSTFRFHFSMVVGLISLSIILGALSQ